MGYYTTFELTVLSGKDYDIDYEGELKEIVGYNPLSGDETKWYSYNTDMEELSKKFPNTTFMLYGNGEENGDQWKAYFKDGKTFRADAVMTFEEFTEDKLK